MLEPAVETVDRGHALLGGDPTRLIRLSAAGARNVAAWRDDGVEREDAPSAVQRLIDRLTDAAMMHPVAAPSRRRVEVVVPVRDRPEALRRCVDALLASGVESVVVVDDGSRDPVLPASTVRVVRREVSGGPAAARTTGFAHTTADLVAFVDSDVLVRSDWLDPLVGLFDDLRVGLVAPRVVHRAGEGLVDRFEEANSPLDLGDRRAPIVAGTRVSYVPAAAVIVRREALEDVGGFDEALDVGEDVDLVWRLADAGWRCRYEPASVVEHHGRDRLGDLLRRRFDYGCSAAALEVRHPGALPPVRGSRWSATVVGSFALGQPFVGLGITARNVRDLASKLDSIADSREVATRLVVRGHVGYARQCARALVRPWLPISLALASVSRRARRVLLIGALWGPVERWLRERPEVPLPSWVALVLADDVSYTAGVWAGCLRERTPGPLVPNRPARATPHGRRASGLGGPNCEN